MRSKTALAAILAAACVSGAASANPTAFDGTLTFVEGLGSSTIASASLSGIPVNASSPTAFTFFVTPPTSPSTPFLSGSVSLPGVFAFGLAGTPLAGSFAGGGGAMPLLGTASVGTPSLGVGAFPLLFVVGGSASASWTTSPFGLRVAQGGPWRTSPAVVNGQHLSGTPFTVQRTGFDSRTPTGGLGMVQFVTPVVVQPLLGGQTVPVFGVLTLNLLPEPGRFVLLASGSAALLFLARLRGRAPSRGGGPGDARGPS